MKWRTFWGIFAVTQLVGALGLGTGSVHGNPLGLLVGFILLFPGSTLCWLILDKLRVMTTGGPVITTSFLVNIVCWSALALAITHRRVRHE